MRKAIILRDALRVFEANFSEISIANEMKVWNVTNKNIQGFICFHANYRVRQVPVYINKYNFPYLSGCFYRT